MRRVPALLVLTLGAAILLRAQGGWNAPTGRDFPLAGGGVGNQRYSSLSQITPANIGRLGGAWMIHVGDGTRNLAATPVIVNGVMYIAAGGGDVLALNAATGATIWRYKSPFGAQNNRGVAVADGKVFTGQAGSHLVALDQKTGEPVWQAAMLDASAGGRGGGTPGATLYSEGRVFSGIAGGEAGVRGQFAAFDAKTGKELWRFNLVPGPGELGHDTWEGDSWTHGGAPLWTQYAIDPDLGLVYIPAGNASPDQDGSQRGGDNLFSVSIVALDVRTGKYRWHFQEVHHDLWDYDNPLPPVLADIQDIHNRGQLRKILIHGGKTGLTYILDRVTGKPLVGIEERAVPQVALNKTARTQPFPLGDSPVPNCPEPGSVASGAAGACVFGAFRADRPVVMAPGTQGGINWAPVTFSPRTNLFYVPGSLINSQYDRGFSRPGGQPRAGTLSAMDPSTNRIVWQVRTKYPLATGSGLLSTASGLLFNGQSDGNLVAYDISNGNELWRFQTGAGADAPVATYEVNGEQYVAILSAGNSFQLSAIGDALWAFKLGGTLKPAPAPEPPPAIQPGAPAGPGGRSGRGGRGSGAELPAGPGAATASGAATVAVFVVNNANDSGPGSLRQAILDSNRAAGPRVIEIDLPADGTSNVISPAGQALPPIKGLAIVRVKGAKPVAILDGSKLVTRRATDACPRESVAGAGLAVQDTADVEIHGLELRNFCIGVAVVGSHDVNLQDLRIGDNLVAGVVLSGGKNALMGNTFTNHPDTAVIVSGADHTIRDNRFVANKSAGLRATGANLLILGNTFSNNGGDALSVSGAGSRVLDNLVSGNRGKGITVGSAGVTLSRNAIFDNDRSGIDVAAGSGVAVIDPSSTWSDGGVTINGSLTGQPGERYAVEIFLSRAADEGQLYIGTASATPNAAGKATFTLTIRIPDILGEGQVSGFVTATVRDAAGSTSRFSGSLALRKR